MEELINRPIFWVAVVIAVIAGLFKSSGAEPLQRMGVVAILLFVGLAVLLLLGVDSAGDLLQWLLGG
jgi:hypothetical protein